ncbi:MAG: hypothetical protein QOE65_2885 [Solirubrobacteraceae bacterium]|jgi:hypothetical protein|nr:hypothetical protein [Solirubrobacteraceae bacterium]
MRAVIGVVGLAVALRVAAMLGYSTAVLNYYTGDAGRYARLAPFPSGYFTDSTAPSGYPMFLGGLRDAWAALPFTVAVQHALGVATGLLLYAAMRRLGAPRLVALVPAAVVLLSGDQIFLEHAILVEGLWSFLIAAGLYALVRGADGAPVNAWLALAGTLLVAAVVVRQVAFALPAIAVLWAAAVRGNGAGARARAGASVLVPAAVTLAVYLAAASGGGGHSGLGESTGWQLYGRVAQFADCSRFDPPHGTEFLCEDTPPARRQGPTWYLYGAGAPLVAHGRPGVAGPQDSRILGVFAHHAMAGQPWDYASAVLSDAVRYAELSGPNRPGSGADAAQMSWDSPGVFGGPEVATRGYAAARYRTRYSGVDESAPLADELGAYQDVMRLHGLLLIPLVALALWGAVVARGRARAGIVLFGSSAMTLYLVPPVVGLWDVRYGVPPGPLLVAAAALAVWSWAARRAPAAGGPDARPSNPRRRPMPRA